MDAHVHRACSTRLFFGGNLVAIQGSQLARLHVKHRIPACIHEARQSDLLPCGRSSRYAPRLSTIANSAASASLGHADGASKGAASNKFVLLSAIVLLFGVGNRILYRMALVPMGHYVFFLAQFQNLSYLVVYFGILYMRYRQGKVTPEMLAIPKGSLLLIGACEAASQLLFMMSASHLPGVLLPIINQTYMVWNLAFASLLLKTRFSWQQITGALLVMAGVATAAAPAAWFPWSSHLGLAAPTLQPGHLKYVAMCAACFAFPGLSTTIKDKLFRSSRQRLGRHLDIFVVNSFSSLYQSLFVVLLLPITLSFNGLSLLGLPQYLQKGANCFQGLAPTCGAPCCEGAPLLPVMYVAANLAFNISILALLRRAGSVTTTIICSCLVPLTIVVFTLPLPYLDPVTMHPNLVLGAAILLLGLVVYNMQKWHIVPIKPDRSRGRGSSSSLTTRSDMSVTGSDQSISRSDQSMSRPDESMTESEKSM